MKRSGIQIGILMIASNNSTLIDADQIPVLWRKNEFEFTALLLESTPERAYPDRGLASV
jgi:hypothetical protein